MQDKDITLEIISPQGKDSFTFRMTAKVSEVIEQARVKFGFEPGGFILKRKTGNETLSPERTLVSYHLSDGDQLLLVPEMGSGV